MTCSKDKPEGGHTNLVSWDEVSNEEKHAHDDVLGDRCDIRAGNFEDLQAFLGGSIEIDVVRADAGGNANLQILGLQLDATISDVSGNVVPNKPTLSSNSRFR